MSEQQLRQERPEEYQRLAEQGALASLQADPPAPWLMNLGRIVGFTVISIGLLLGLLTVRAFLSE